MKRILLLLILALAPPQDGTTRGECRSRPLPGDAASLARFELPAAPFPWTLAPASAEAGERQFVLTFPSAVKNEPAENNIVTCKVWMPKDDTPKPRPSVVLLHYLRGTFKPMEVAGRAFADRGFVAVLVYMPHYGPRASADPALRKTMISDDVASTVEHFRQAVLDIRRAGDWLRSRKDVDPNRVGLFGVSMGSVVGALVAGVDLRFTRSALVVGGGDLPSLVLHESKETSAMRKKLLDGGWTAEKLATALAPIEPLGVAPRVDPSGVLLLNAELDQVVPRECTEKLRAAMGGPRIRWYKGDHYTIVLALPEIIKTSADHLSERPTR